MNYENGQVAVLANEVIASEIGCELGTLGMINSISVIEGVEYIWWMPLSARKAYVVQGHSLQHAYDEDGNVLTIDMLPPLPEQQGE
jgi:hypothetical protein